MCKIGGRGRVGSDVLYISIRSQNGVGADVRRLKNCLPWGEEYNRNA